MKPLEGARVVLWANQPDVRDTLAGTFARLGSSVETLGSPAELAEKVTNGAADLVVMELRGRCLDCLELIAWLHEAQASLPILVVVDTWNQDLYLEALRRGARDGLGLPLDEKELVRIASLALKASCGFCAA